MSELIEDWKKEYGELRYTNINEVDFIFRLLNYNEYQEIMKLTDDEDVDIDAIIASTCVLDPIIEDWDGNIYAGYVNTLSRLILEESLLISKSDNQDDVKTLIKEKTQEVENTFIKQIPIIIAHAFPQYRLREIETMSLCEQIDLYAKAVWAIQQFEGIELNFSDGM